MTETSMAENILNLSVEVRNQSALRDSQLIQPPTVQSEEAFREIINSKRCIVCMRVPRYPASILHPLCGHEGCESCLRQCTSCPVSRCGAPCDKLLTFDSWPKSARDAFNRDLLVKCKSCNVFKSGTMKELLKHEVGECTNRIVQCPRCERYGTPREIVSHYRNHSEVDGSARENLPDTLLALKTTRINDKPALPFKLSRTHRTLIDTLSLPNYHVL